MTRVMARWVNLRIIGMWVMGVGVVLLLGLATRHRGALLEKENNALRSVLPNTRIPLVAVENQPEPIPPPQAQEQQQQQQQKQADHQAKGKIGGPGGSGSRCGRAQWVEGLPPLYIITPTYPRAEQLPELTRTAQTLLNVPNVVWIVSEDAPSPTAAVVEYLNESDLKNVYLRVQMPEKYQTAKNKPRGVANRLAGLQWIRDNAKDGVLYFADDDNTYDIRLFEQMRWTRQVSMFPVGLVTKLAVSTPIIRNGKVVGFYDGWIAKRKFPIDMAGFAVNVHYLLKKPEATMPYRVGYEEDGFMNSLGIKPHEIEPLAFNCTKIWVWHTQTKKNDPAKPVVQNNSTIGTNLDIIKDLLWKG